MSRDYALHPGLELQKALPRPAYVLTATIWIASFTAVAENGHCKIMVFKNNYLTQLQIKWALDQTRDIVQFKTITKKC